MKIIYDIKFEGLENAQKGLEQITKLQIEQQTAVQQTKNEIKSYEKALEELRDEMAMNESATASQIEYENQLSESILNSKLNLSDQKDELSNISKTRRQAVKGVDEYNTALDSEIGSNEQLKAQLSILTKTYNTLSEEERETTEAGQQLTTQINSITEKLKENEGAIGDNRRNVGNYEQAVTNALGKVEIFGVNLGQVTHQIKSGVEAGKGLIKTTLAQAEASTAQATATTGAAASNGVMSKSLKVLRVALISTGIGAIVVALGALVAAFASTQRGADAFTRVITPLKFVVQKLWGVLQDVSIGLVDTVKGFNSLGDAVKSLGKAILDNLIERGKSAIDVLIALATFDFKKAGKEMVDVFTGVENTVDKLSESTKELSEDIKKAIQDGKDYANAQIAMEQAQIRLTVAIAQTNKDLKEQRLIASDQTKTDKERIEALTKATKLATQRSNQEKSLVKQELALAELKAKQNDTDRTAYLEIATLKAKLIDLDAAALSEQKAIVAQQSQLIKRQADQEQARIDKLQKLIEIEEEQLIKARNAKLEELELNKNTTELMELEVEARNAIFDKYYDDLSKQRLAFINKELEDQNNLNLELEKTYYQDLLNAQGNEEAKKQITAQYNKDKLDSLRDTVNAQIQIVTSELEPLLASADNGIADSILNEKDRQALEERLKKLQKELAKTNYEYSQLGIDPITGEKKTLGELLGIDSEGMQDVVASFQAVMSSISSIVADANSAMQARTEARVKAIDEALKKGTKSESEAEAEKQQVRRESFEKQKEMELAMAAIQFAQGSVAALAGAMTLGNPIVGAIVGAAAVAALGASYGFQVDKINAQTFAEGGYVQGPGTGTSDSINAKLSNGEYVQTAAAVSHYGVGFMEAVNKMQLPKFASGGLYTAPSPINNIGTQVSKGVKPIADSINSMQLEVINIESKFSKLQTQVTNVETAGGY